jgi:hypothetical protein
MPYLEIKEQGLVKFEVCQISWGLCLYIEVGRETALLAINQLASNADALSHWGAK